MMIRFDSVPPEIMQAMCTPMHQIIPSSASAHTGALYLGSFSAILDPDLLLSNGIASLVQVLDAPWLPTTDAHAEKGVKLDCYRLNILDSTSTDIAPHLESTVTWIDERLRKGKNVLVHCQQGISRSAAVVIAYLIFKYKMSYDSAFNLVKRKRACIKPNAGFVRALQEWEKQWCIPSHPSQRPSMRRAATAPVRSRPSDDVGGASKSKSSSTEPGIVVKSSHLSLPPRAPRVQQVPIPISILLPPQRTLWNRRGAVVRPLHITVS
ncbi:hypothetical protein QCA50_004005 [Cerrena zonata]|uniref:protein-tyrosine-phosphatase n=1 Tax=Cerrena zonata TaxID=2478898 RepID=A0AAW0GT19_9APHY